MTKEEKKLKKLIEESEKILVTTHRSPDFDAKSSAILVYHAINMFFEDKDVDIIMQSGGKLAIEGLDWGYVDDDIVRINRSDEVDLFAYDLIIMTDVDELNRSIEGGIGERSSYHLAIIDHHQAVPGAKEDADLYINEELSSAAEQVYKLFRSILGDQWVQDEYISRITQYGIVADTDRFKYDMTTPQTFETMAELTRVHRVDQVKFHNSIHQRSANSHLVLAECLRNIHKVDNLGYSYLEKDFIESNDLTDKDRADGVRVFRNESLTSIEDIDWGFVAYEFLDIPNKWTISFRALAGKKDVSVLAEKLGGGGHKLSAAAAIEAEDKDDAIQQVLSAI